MIRPRYKIIYLVRIGCWWRCSKWFYDRFPGFKATERVAIR